MPNNTHTTATVRLQLDLSGLVTQLRELADTLEAAQKGRARQADDPEPEPPIDCTSCGTTYADCNQHIKDHGRGCCGACYTLETHDQHQWEAWRRRQAGNLASASTPKVRMDDPFGLAAASVVAGDE